MPRFQAKLQKQETTIFTKMSRLAVEYNAINLGQGFPDFDCDKRLQDLIGYHAHTGRNQYAPMMGVPVLLDRLAERYNNKYATDISGSENITVTAGATQALFTAISAFVGKGDEVIIFEPSYDSYAPTVRLNGGIPVPISLSAPDYKINWQQVQEAITAETRMIIINNPHNPVGKILSRNDLLQLQNLVEDRDIIVLSDEVYEHLVYDGLEHESVLKYKTLFDQSIACFSFGKTFHITGWKLGYVIGPKNLIKEFRNVHQWNVFSVNSISQYAIADYLENDDNINQLSQFFQGKRDYFESLMRPGRFVPLSNEGSYFQLYDYSAISDEDDVSFTERLVKEYGVAAIPVSVFYNSGQQEKLIRFCFAKKEETLKAAAEKLIKI